MHGVRVHPAVALSPPLLSMTAHEPPERRIERMVAENPVIVLSRRSCYMSDVMKRLLSTVGVHPAALELDDDEAASATRSLPIASLPVAFIGGGAVGGVESLVALHVGGRLVPLLAEAGALRES